MADGSDLRSTQVTRKSLMPYIAFGSKPTGLDRLFREYFFGLVPVTQTESSETMISLVSMLSGLSLNEITKIEQLMLAISTRADCDDGIDAARNVISQ